MIQDIQTIALRKPPDADAIEAIARSILNELGPPFDAVLASLAIRIADWPDDEMLDDHDIEDAYDLTGLCVGTIAGDLGGDIGAAQETAMIHLFRLPILAEWCGRGCALREVVFDVVTHELGHFFGMNEEEVLRMEGRDLD